MNGFLIFLLGIFTGEIIIILTLLFISGANLK